MRNISRSDLVTLPDVLLTKPFGKVSLRYLPDGTKRVRAYLRLDHIRQGVQTGVALEGSHLMRGAFGYRGMVGPLFRRQSGANLMTKVTRKIGSYLASKVDADRSTTILYWATGPTGEDVELVGDLATYKLEQQDFSGPAVFGSSVHLLPAVRLFAERFVDAPWGMFVFLTQGHIDDLDAVTAYSTRLAAQIAAGQRKELKLVLIGVGPEVDTKTLAVLDDLDTGHGVDLWDFKLAAEMQNVLEIFAEAVDENMVVAPTGTVLDDDGRVLAEYPRGLPALLVFEAPANSRGFWLEMNDLRVRQQLL